MIRLFVGLRPSAAMRSALTAAMGGIDGARWQSADQLHITLRFIGEVPRPVAEEVALALSSVRFAPFALGLDGVGRFETRGRTRAVWARVTPRDEIAALHKKIDRALVRIGLEPERRAYFPHVTIARLNAGSGPVERFLDHHRSLNVPPLRFDNFLLFQSTLGGEGAQYDAVSRYRAEE